MAEILELFQERLASSYLGWMLDNAESSTKEEMDVAKAFFEYAYQEAKEAIVAPRRGGSYEECRRSH